MFLCVVVITYEKLVLYVQVSDNTTRKTVNGVQYTSLCTRSGGYVFKVLSLFFPLWLATET